MASRAGASTGHLQRAESHSAIEDAARRLLKPEPASDQHHLVAPVWHTFALLAVFAALVAIGIRAQLVSPAHTGTAPPRSLVPIQLQAIAFEWTMFAFVWLGLRLRRVPLRQILGARWARPGTMLVDSGLAIGLWAAWAIGSRAISSFLGAGQNVVPFPTVPLEAALAVCVAISAAICEEAIFRGYFQRQFGALIGNTTVALFAQSIVFGIAHAYQGARTAVMAGLYGFLLGALAVGRKSLRPGMFAHAMSDISARLLQF